MAFYIFHRPPPPPLLFFPGHFAKIRQLKENTKTGSRLQNSSLIEVRSHPSIHPPIRPSIHAGMLLFDHNPSILTGSAGTFYPT